MRINSQRIIFKISFFPAGTCNTKELYCFRMPKALTTKKRSMDVSKERLNSRAIHAITLRNVRGACPVKVSLLAAFFIARATQRRACRVNAERLFKERFIFVLDATTVNPDLLTSAMIRLINSMRLARSCYYHRSKLSGIYSRSSTLLTRPTREPSLSLTTTIDRDDIA